MSRKTILPTTLLIAFIVMGTTGVIAQRTTKGRLFMFEPRPRFNTNTLSINPGGRHSKFRSYDGKNNNVYNSQTFSWGAADITLFREMPAAYGPSDPRNAMNGVNRPSARKISNVLIDEPVTVFNTRELSTLVYQWGQFLDHEMTLTPTDTIESVPIVLPADEIVFTENIPFTRSEFRKGAGFQNSVRQQINLNTSWIDGSVVYGSDAKRARWLRTLSKGKLKTSTGNLLPYNTITGELTGAIDPTAPSMKNDNGGTTKTFVAGDVRAAENPVLTSIQTLFVREHNRICDRLLSEGQRDDEQIYQMARKEVGALIQAITYQEFLPALGITLRPYPGYRADTRPDITNTFATAAYRLGHTMVSDDVLLIDKDCNEAGPGEMDLISVFWNPQLVADYGIDVFLKGSASHDQYETDTKINSVLRNFLFGNPNDPVRFGIDLGSLNIQRGRDHGLPDYNSARRFYTGRAATKFSDISSNDTIATALKRLYGSVNNIDLWIGVLAEDHLQGKSVGNTLHEMIKAQFEKLRNGDYYFYFNDPNLPANIKARIRNTKFSDVIKRNTELTNIVANVFHTEECAEDVVAVRGVPVVAKVNSTESIKATGIKIFPNPASDILNVDFVNANEPSVVKIFSANGELVKTFATGINKGNLQINVSGLAKGLYAINIITGKEMKSYTFIKL
ncbi:MAG: peroxidase family protein [Chitinophagaceae bacterium]